jgi:pilus assembly protein CpaF
MQEIYRFHRRGLDKDGKIRGEYEATGIRPHVMELVGARGIDASGLSFSPSRRTP